MLRDRYCGYARRTAAGAGRRFTQPLKRNTLHRSLAIVDMDLGEGQVLDHLLAASILTGRIPSIALTRRGDLRAKLEAFEHGADAILTVPLSAEELIAQTLAIMRRTYHEAIPFAPIIRLGELEVDILHRHVRSGAGERHDARRVESRPNLGEQGISRIGRCSTGRPRSAGSSRASAPGVGREIRTVRV